MGCSIPFVYNTSVDTNQSFSFDDLLESEVSLDQIHDEIAFLRINVEKQKQIYPEDYRTEVTPLANSNYIQLIPISKSDTKSKRPCLKQQLTTLPAPLTQDVNPKRVHFVEIQSKQTNQCRGGRKKSKNKRQRKSEEIQEHINLDDIF
ncbi:unnamed protein product (macronuclear) [Paramecium tetraurelia]|uniref:Uncharacterized protein n=1 Tax=Paramecium tetraurelia TaxID=5888 RepID=A0CAP3_PARTE|nr:uncharacterized protein GSPATT00036641001 [Paramecium tetraurelia]CAK67860.1 unnamed protein product [Paramecium tetraurelia]|eukprot:XP_001435257.1 hypothetical protein (macronuclear) [Paramecium tetraurelia strain d4-2]